MNDYVSIVLKGSVRFFPFHEVTPDSAPIMGVGAKWRLVTRLLGLPQFRLAYRLEAGTDLFGTWLVEITYGWKAEGNACYDHPFT